MCSEFVASMENFQGDLADIIRSSGGGGGGGGGIGGSSNASLPPDWQFPSNPTIYSSGIEGGLEEFGDPFSNAQDPLLHDMDMEMDMPSSGLFTIPSHAPNLPITCTSVGGAGNHNNNIFSRMLQISPRMKLPAVSVCDSPVVAAAASLKLKSPPTIASNDSISSVNPKGCLVDNAGLQISSPRNTGIKRRKSQAKKVVCIPAPAPANSRQSGEVVPSDLWAWRKYGQKPIKGSPYPRGYYRCSSSKGCSARKQVERSRTDPNMLVITYTSEHNHPWPTQRNALAGSTRSQPAKNSSSPKTTSSSPTSQPQNEKSNRSSQHERKESQKDHVSSSSIVHTNSITDPPVKEEMEDVHQKKAEMEDFEFGSRAYPQSSNINPALPVVSNQSEDFFAELGEIEADPLHLLFSTQGFSGDHDERGNKAALDPFNFYDDWPENNSSNSNTTLLAGEAKKGLQQNH